MSQLTDPQIHFIPGYTRFSPPFKDRVGDKDGTVEDKIAADNVGKFRPSEADIHMVNDRDGDILYKHPMVCGYEGFVPGEHAKFGKTYTTQATEAFSDFERIQHAEKGGLHPALETGYLHNSKWEPKTLENEELPQSEFKLPVLEIRPECGVILRNVPVTESPLKELPETSPKTSHHRYISDYAHPEKYLKSGYTGHVPYGNAAFGGNNEEMSNYLDYENAWIPIEIERPAVLVLPVEIYHKYIGQIPHYTGHIPGAMYRYGKSFGSDSKNAKRWLRGDFKY